MGKVINCGLCGKEFVRKSARHLYCSYECRMKADKLRKERRKAEKSAKIPAVTLGMMVEAVDRLSKERGRYVSYGQVQKELTIGKLKVKGGVIVDPKV